jgi:hypothetical protein
MSTGRNSAVEKIRFTLKDSSVQDGLIMPPSPEAEKVRSKQFSQERLFFMRAESNLTSIKPVA